MTTNWVRAAAFILAAGLCLSWITQLAAQVGYCLAASALALAWLAHRWRRRRDVVITAPWAILALTAGWMLTQRLTNLASDPEAAAVETAVWSAGALLSLATMNELDVARTLSGPLRAAGLAAGLISLWALLQGPSSAGKVLWLFEGSAQAERVWGPFVYHNKLAQFAELLLPVTLCLWATESRRRWAWLAAAAGLAAATVAAASRAGVALLMLEFPVCALLLAWRRVISWRQGVLLPAKLALVVAAVVMVAGWEPLAARVNVQQMMSDRRFDLNASSWEMAKAHLPWGAGYGSWPAVYPEFARFDDGRYANQAHNDWLQWLCEGGLPGLALMALFAALLVVPLLRSVWGVGVLFVLTHAVVDYPFHQSAPLAVLVMVVAVAAHRDGGRWLCRSGGGQYAPSPLSTTFTVLPRM